MRFRIELHTLWLLLAVLTCHSAWSQNRYWVADSPANWNSDNWSTSSNGAPDGGGPPTASETARFDANGNGNCTLDLALDTVTDFYMTSYTGVIEFDGNSLRATGTVTLTSGTLDDNSGGSEFVIASSGTVTFNGTEVGVRLDVDAAGIELDGSTFTEYADLHKNSTGNSYGSGGNHFMDTVILTHSGASGYLLTGGGSADTFDNFVSANSTGTGYCYLSYSGSGHYYQGDIEMVSTNSSLGVRIGNGAGTSTMTAGNTVQIGSSGFSTGILELRGFTQLGSTAISLSPTGTTTTTIYDCVFGGDATFSSERFTTRGTTYNGTASITKTGAASDASAGGNVFEGNATLTNSGSGYLLFGNGTPDSFNLDLNWTNSGTHYSYLAYNSTNNYVGGDLTVTNSATGTTTYFYVSSVTGSSLTVDGDVSATNSGSSTDCRLIFGDQGSVTVNGDASFVNSGSGTTSNVQIANNANSTVTFGGVLRLENTASTTTGNIYLGNNGDLSVADSLYVLNSSTSTNSLIYCNHNTNSSATYSGDMVLENSNASSDGIYFGQAGGNATLATGQTMSIGSNGFQSGILYLRNFTQTGATAQNLTLTSGATTTIYDADFGGNFTLDSPNINTRGTNYQGNIDFRKSGSTNENQAGGNTVAGTALLTNVGTGYWLWGNGSPDSFMSGLTIYDSSSYNFYFAYNSADNYVSGNVDYDKVNSGTNTYTYFCDLAGSSLEITGNLVFDDLSTSTNPRSYLGDDGALTIGGDFTFNGNSSSTTGYGYIGVQSSGSATIGGDASISHGNSGTAYYFYFGNSGDVTLTGDLTLDNNTSITTANMYVANNSTSSVTIGGVTRLDNDGSGTTRQAYLGNSGDVTFNDSLIILNSSDANSSQVYLNHASTSTNAYNEDILVESTDSDNDGILFGNGQGSGTLAAGQTISISSNGFQGYYLYFRNFTQTGATAQTLHFTGGTGFIYNYQSSWGGDVDFYSPGVYYYDNTFSGTATVEKTGSTNDQSPGLNYFAGNVSFTNSGSGYWLMGNGGADTFMMDLTIDNSGSNNFYIGYNSGDNYVGGDLVANHSTTGGNTYIYLCNTDGTTLQVDGDVTIDNTSSSTGSYIYLANTGDVTIAGDLDISNTGSGTNAYVYVSNAHQSSTSVGGTTTVTNDGTATTNRVYLCNWGDITASDSVILSNSSATTSSYIYCNLEDSSVADYQADIVMELTDASGGGITFGQNGGSATLADGQTISIGSGGFVAGALYFYRFDQIGNTAQTLNATGTTYMYQFECDWDGNVDFSAPRFRTDYTRYDGTATLEKTGATDDASVGGNYFGGDAILTNSGSRYFMMGNGNPDTFAMDLTMNNTGTYHMYLAQSSAGNYIGGDFTINQSTSGSSASMVISNGATSTLEVAGNTVATHNSTATTSNFYLGNGGDITFGGDLDITHTTGTTTSQLLMAYSSTSAVSVGGVTHLQSEGSGTTTLCYIGYQGDVTFADSVYLLNDNSGTTNDIRVAYEDNSFATFSGDIIVECSDASGDGVTFGAAGGSGSMADGQRIEIGPNGFVAGNLFFYRFDQIGNTTQSLTTTGTSYIYNYQSDWDANLTLIGPRNRTDYTDFGGNLTFEKSGGTDESSVGGNRVAGNADITCSSSGYLQWGSTLADSVIGNLTLTNTGSRGIYFAGAGSDHYVGGDITGTNTGTGTSTWIYLANGSTASLQVDGDVSLSGAAPSTTNTLVIGNSGDMTIGGDVTLTNEGTSTTSYGYIANGSTSNVSIGGVTRLTNAESGTTHRMYAGNSGDIQLGDSLYALNSSDATNSQIYVNYGSASEGTFAGDIVVESSDASCDGVLFGANTGTGTLAAGQTVTVGSAGFVAGTLYFRNFTQTGATAQSITLTSTATFNNYNADWGGDVTFVSPRFYTYSTRYRGTAYLEKSGANSDASAGLNRIDGDATLVNTGSGYFLMGNGNPDSLMSNATFTNSGTHYMYFGNSTAGHYIGGDLVSNLQTTGTNSYMYFANNSGSTIQVDGDATFNCTSTASNPRYYIGNAGSIDFNGDLTYSSTATGTSSYSYIASGSASTVTIDGVTTINHSPTGSTTHYFYLGSSGDITFNDSVYIFNNSSATNNFIYCNNASTAASVFNGHIVVESYNASSDGIYFGVSSGTATLASGNTISIGPNGFSSGTLYLRNFDQQGATEQNLSLTGTGTLLRLYGSEFDGGLDFDAPRVLCEYTDFNGSVDLEKTGATNDASAGGNTFNDDFTMRNSGTSYFMIPNNVADDYNGDVTYEKTSTGLLYPSYNITSTYAGDINFNTNAQVTLAAAGSGRIEFDGSGPQSVNDVGSSTEPNFRYMTINNSADSVTLNMPIEVQTDITFTDGILVTDTTNIIELRDNATATGASDASFVYGYVQKVGNEAFDFPVGDSLYRPISISAPSSGSAAFRATYVYNNPAPTYTYGAVDAPLDHVSTREYWILDRTNSTNNVNVTLSWDVNSGGVDDLDDLLVARWDGDSWVSHGNGGTTGNTTTGTVVTSSAVSSFSPFTLGSSTANNPLPIELLTFDATALEDQVDLDWMTATEINNDFFTLERSADGLRFTDIGLIKGAGNTTEIQSYQFTDYSPLSGASFYRLKQTDFNGDVSYSDLRMVYFGADDRSTVAVYSAAEEVVIDLDLTADESLSISFFNLDGQLIYAEQVQGQDGFNNYRIPESNIGATGVYLIRLEGKYTQYAESLFIR